MKKGAIKVDHWYEVAFRSVKRIGRCVSIGTVVVTVDIRPVSGEGESGPVCLVPSEILREIPTPPDA